MQIEIEIIHGLGMNTIWTFLDICKLISTIRLIVGL
jgi:hypothetical protein